jgi:hypothetical protein
MFNPFKRKKRFSDYVVDLGKLKSRGIIKEPLDDASSVSSSETAGSMGFLGSMANAASESTFSSNEPSEDKIRSFSERLYKILDRLDLLEHKIDRIERKIGLKEEY